MTLLAQLSHITKQKHCTAFGCSSFGSEKCYFQQHETSFFNLASFGNKSQFITKVSYSFTFHWMSSDLLEGLSSFLEDIPLALDFILNMTIFR